MTDARVKHRRARAVRELVETLALAGDSITRTDRVKHLQAAGLADNTADPAQYAAQAADEVAMGNIIPTNGDQQP